MTDFSNILMKSADFINTKRRYHSEPIYFIALAIMVKFQCQLPIVHFMDVARVDSKQYPEQMFQDILENTRVEFMQELNNE